MLFRRDCACSSSLEHRPFVYGGIEGKGEETAIFDERKRRLGERGEQKPLATD